MDPTNHGEREPLPSRSLLELPLELVVGVVEHLSTDKRTLCSLARTCQLLQYECEKRIYTTIELLSTNDLRAIIDAFLSRPERIASVETLKILYIFHNALGATSLDRNDFNQCVTKMTALKHWHVESPFDNFNWGKGGEEWVEQDMEVFRKVIEAASLRLDHGQFVPPGDVGLSKLERLVIHSHGADSDFWTLDGFHCLFQHPSLRYLHASCFVLPKDIPELDSYAKSTPLNTLIFDECEIEPRSLGVILRTPKSLKHLTLGENVYNIHRASDVLPKLSLASEAALDALKGVAHSLETLTHYDPYWRMLSDLYHQRPPKGHGLRDFHRLKFLDVDPCSFLHQAILSPMQAPPNLDTLRIHYARVRIFEMFDFPETDLFERLPPIELYMSLETVETLEFVQGACIQRRISTPAYICDADRLRTRHAYAHKLHQQGINVKVYLEATWRDGLIPPFLHGEQTPELVCVYDAAQVGFRRHIIESDDETQATKPEGTNDELPLETDQLNTTDMIRLKNELGRILDKLEIRWAAMDSDSEDGDAIIIVDETDDDDEDDEDDEDDFDEDEWFDAEDIEDDEIEIPDEDDDSDVMFSTQTQPLTPALGQAIMDMSNDESSTAVGVGSSYAEEVYGPDDELD